MFSSLLYITSRPQHHDAAMSPHNNTFHLHHVHDQCNKYHRIFPTTTTIPRGKKTAYRHQRRPDGPVAPVVGVPVIGVVRNFQRFRQFQPRCACFLARLFSGEPDALVLVVEHGDHVPEDRVAEQKREIVVGGHDLVGGSDR